MATAIFQFSDLYVCIFICRSRLILSESMAHQSRQAPAFHRAASTVQAHFSGDRQFLGSVTSTDTETSDLLKLAKDNIEKLKEKGKKVSGGNC